MTNSPNPSLLRDALDLAEAAPRDDLLPLRQAGFGRQPRLVARRRQVHLVAEWDPLRIAEDVRSHDMASCRLRGPDQVLDASSQLVGIHRGWSAFVPEIIDDLLEVYQELPSRVLEDEEGHDLWDLINVSNAATSSAELLPDSTLSSR